MNPIIYDNFLPDFYHRSILNALTATDFAWYFTEKAGGDGDIDSDAYYPQNQYGFNHLAFNFDGGGVTSAIYPLLQPMVEAIKDKTGHSVDNLLRIRIGLSTNIGEEGARFPHVDYEFPHKTLLYYVNDSDGDTVFYHQRFIDHEPKEFTVEMRNTPVANQAVLFDGLHYHSSGFPTKNSKRIAINVNFF